MGSDLQLCHLHILVNCEENKLMKNLLLKSTALLNKLLKIRVVVWSSLPSLQGAGLLGSAQRKAPCTHPHLPLPCSLLAIARHACLGSGHCGTHHCLVPTLSLATFHSWPLLGTASWSFGRTHLTTEEEHFLTEELMTSSQLFKSLKRRIHLTKEPLCSII